MPGGLVKLECEKYSVLFCRIFLFFMSGEDGGSARKLLYFEAWPMTLLYLCIAWGRGVEVVPRIGYSSSPLSPTNSLNAFSFFKIY